MVSFFKVCEFSCSTDISRDQHFFVLVETGNQLLLIVGAHQFAEASADLLSVVYFDAKRRSYVRVRFFPFPFSFVKLFLSFAHDLLGLAASFTTL